MLSIQIDTQSLESVQQYQIVLLCKQYENEFVQLLDTLDDIRKYSELLSESQLSSLEPKSRILLRK